MERSDWNRLVRALDEWSSAAEIAPGQIEVALRHGGTDRHVVIVMTADEWAEMTGVMWGAFDDAVEDVKASLMSLQAHEGFAVYSQYRLEPSTTTDLRKPTQIGPASGGDWVTHDREGRISSRLGKWSEPEQG